MSQPTDIVSAEMRFCPECGYNLRGVTSDRCPECGLLISSADSSSIPWAHRKQIGRLKAFWRTLVLSTFRPIGLTAGTAASDEYQSAQRFRWIVVTLGSLPSLLFLAGTIWYEGGTGFLSAVSDAKAASLPLVISAGWEIALLWSAGATLLPVLPIGIVVVFVLWTGAPGYWFCPRSLAPAPQDRAVAISRYSCAPLAWLPLPAAALAAAIALRASGQSQNLPLWHLFVLLICLGCGLLALIVLASWRTTLQLLSRTTHCGAGRLVAAAVGVPLSWIVSAAIGLGVLPCLVGFVFIVIDGFH